MSVDDGIREFWTWWTTARERVVHAIEVERSFSEELIADIGRHVDAIGDLDWELCPGASAKHAFCLSPKGNPDGRLVTEVWRQRGPAADETWEYYPARQARLGTTLEIDDVRLDRDELVAALEVDTDRERVYARYFHPRFVDLPEDRRVVALFLLLDGALGEDRVERWLGGIDLADDEPEEAVPFHQLLEAVAELERTATREKYAILKGESEEGLPLFITCNMALKRIDHLLNTMHVAIDLAILDQNPQGLTTEADADALNAIEDELSAALGASAVYFGRETRPGHRVLHWYVPEDGPAERIIAAWAHDHPDRRPHVEITRDPGWEFVKNFV
ncbi:MAG: DUF695 domain-containing protein [Myxococcales bacterium]|nr:DUF695 domain-containing protein [Myxococcales bacterium]